ncbi:MAG: TlyA family RNA methyltransferase [Bacteroidetes bacterium]|nr:TlyA family RNA methyltransferase [Bacteroidota bacterium]
MRLDIYLINKAIFSSRIKAQEAISEGLVKVNGKEIYKSSFQVTGDEKIEAEYPDSMRYVSRGGLKLEKALQSFEVSPEGKVVLDAGASTGGFTDCLLKNGAKKVWAVDVGEGQLHKSLQNVPRVVSIEKMNIKELTIEHLDNSKPDWIVADLSFISLTHVFEVFSKLLADDGLIIALIKPQFEAGKENIGKGGIVRSKNLHIKILNELSVKSKTHNLYLNKIDFAPIYDDSKNIEYLGLFSKAKSYVPDLRGVVDEAFGS